MIYKIWLRIHPLTLYLVMLQVYDWNGGNLAMGNTIDMSLDQYKNYNDGGSGCECWKRT